ncbi:MAG: AsnC family transcriptional regulator [Thermoplasmatales archaeon]|jgi:Lrp/AsnC family transcriptional regulator for asnA, asnC and gidA|nr:AsnC family transcriptional regulator [Thermoplasmatales archaeon]
MNLDKIDNRIISTLVKNARTPFRQIAKELNVSPDTIANRFEKLKKDKVILGSTVVLNPEKIGYATIVRFGFKIRPTFSSEMLSTIIKIPSIIIATKLMGEFDVIALGVVKNFDHLFILTETFVQMPNIEKVHVSVWVKTLRLKPEYFII